MYMSEIKIVCKRPAPTAPFLNTVKPYTYEVWASIAGSTLAVGLAMSFILWRSGESCYGIQKGFGNAVKVILTQGEAFLLW